MKIYIRAFLFLLAALTLSSCIDMQRKIRLNSDGSGSEKILITLNKNSILAMQFALSKLDVDSVSIDEDIKEIQEMFKDTMYLAEIRKSFGNFAVKDSLKLISVKEKSSTDSTKSFEIYYSFSSVKNLIGDKLTMMPDDEIPVETEKKISPIDFIVKDNYFEFSYKLGKNSEVDTLKQYDSLKILSDKIMETVFGKSTISFEVITENKIISSNADSWKGKNALWNILMIDYMRKQRILNIKFEN